MSFKRILVPLDGSSLAESAVASARALAGATGTLLLVRAAEAHARPGADPTDAQVEVVREAEDYLAEVAARLAADGFTRVDTSVWYGPAAPSIVDAARLRKADLIAMCTHGRTGLGRLFMGSVAESVLRGTVTPILLLHAQQAARIPEHADAAVPEGAIL
jgi:nucleotide-binding universal stress UspA family protein